MKHLATLLLAFLLFTAAKCQEPDTLIFPYYTIEQGDSLKVIIQEQKISIDSLIASKVFNPLMIADTCSYIIMGVTDSLKVSVEKQGGSVKIGLKNGEKIVFYVDY